MSENTTAILEEWVDPDDAPEWTEEMFDTAAHFANGVMIRPATHKLGPGGALIPMTPGEQLSVAAVVAAIGRPKLERAKQQVTLRLDQDVLERFRAGGPGWQTRINAALRKAVGI